MSMNEKELLKWDEDHIVHWVMPVGQNAGVILNRSSRVSFYDAQGKEYLDGSSQLVCVSLGYAYNDEIAAAAAEQLKKLPYMTTFWGFASDAVIDCSQKLAEFMPEGLNHFCFTNGGTESTELAFQLARLYWKLKGERKYKIISLYNSYHGTSFGAGAATGVARGMFSSGYIPVVPGFIKAPSYYCYRCMLGLEYPQCGIQCAKHVENVIQLEGPDNIAAFIAEPEHGTAGDIPPPPEYWPIIRDICTKHDVLLIGDEVMTGFGRTGKNFGLNHWDIKPDMMTLGKGIISSYLPFGAVVLNDEIHEALKGSFIAGATYSGHPVAAAVSSKVLEIYKRDNVFENAAKMGQYAMERLKAEFLPLPCVGEVSGLGLMIGIEIVEDKEKKRGFEPDPVTGVMNMLKKKALENGLLIRVTDESWSPSNRLSFGPPLISNKEEIDRMLDILYSLLNDLKTQ